MLVNNSLSFVIYFHEIKEHAAQMEQLEYLNTCLWMTVNHLPFIKFNLYNIMQLLSQAEIYAL